MMVFIGSPPYPKGHIRRDFRRAVLKAWQEVKGAELVVSTTRPDQRWRKAEKLAQLYNGGKYYILADDDCTPLPPWDLDHAVTVLDRLKDVAIASAAMPGQDWPEEFHPLHAVGGIRIVRTGVLSFPADFKGHDSDAYNLHVKAGYRSGVLNFIRANHLGMGFSTEWRHKSFFS